MPLAAGGVVRGGARGRGGGAAAAAAGDTGTLARGEQSEALAQRDGNCTWRHQLMYRYGVIEALAVLLAGTDSRAQESAVRVVSHMVHTVSLQVC